MLGIVDNLVSALRDDDTRPN